jgi:SAM-dependent methyltransferase
MDVCEGDRILELGAGNGEMWVKNIDRLPPDASVLVSDISEEFLEQSKNRIDMGSGALDFGIIDIHNIGYPAASFDKILANTMLYHCDDIDVALRQVSRVLADGGGFYSSTSGLDHLIEIKEIVQEFDSGIVFPLNGLNRRFCLENGTDILSKVFSDIECIVFENSLMIDDIDFFHDFILTFKDDKTHNIKPIVDAPEEFKRFLSSKMKNGFIKITKSNCVFVAKS